MDNCTNEDQTIVITDETYLILQKIDCFISEIGGPLERRDQPLSRYLDKKKIKFLTFKRTKMQYIIYI